jgi:hypothetical protein
LAAALWKEPFAGAFAEKCRILKIAAKHMASWRRCHLVWGVL